MTSVREERPEDAAAIRQVLAACFPTDAEARLVDLLRAAGHLTVSLVAEEDGQVIGHVAFSPVSAASGDAFQAIELQAGTLPEGVGPIRCAPEFASLEQPRREGP